MIRALVKVVDVVNNFPTGEIYNKQIYKQNEKNIYAGFGSHGEYALYARWNSQTVSVPGGKRRPYANTHLYDAEWPDSLS